MTTYQLRVDGGTLIPIDAAIAQNDDLLRAAIGAAMPELANGTIQRHPEKDGVVMIELVKRATHKGSAGGFALATLDESEGGINPALKAWQDYQGADVANRTPDQIIALSDTLKTAVDAGYEHARRMESAQGRLDAAIPIAAPFPVLL